jgi:hypothetical protein
MDSRKKNFVIAAVVAGTLSLAAGTVAAQDYFFPLFGAYVDHPVPGDSPCGYTPVRSVTPTTFENTIMLYYLCEDNRVIARRFFRTGNSAQLPQPVYMVDAPGSEITGGGLPSAISTPTSTPAQTTAPVGCPAGFVSGVSGGCVPPNHPLAVR